VGGIGSMLMKEKSEDTSGEEQPTKQKDTRSKKEIVLDAVREGKRGRGRGNYSSPDAVGPAVSIQGNVIRGLEDAGKVSKERKTPEEMERRK
jgi:putative cofactor-binding repeat protein